LLKKIATTIVVLGSAAVGVGPASASPAPPVVGLHDVARPATCHGERATIVGRPGVNVKGTERADVIVSGGAQWVIGRGGDDVICVTGNTLTSSVDVEDGAGDDWVSTRATGDLVFTRLFSGDNTFLGGSGADSIVLYGPGRDLVDTGGGDDYINFGQLRASGAGSHIHAGRGADTFRAGVAPRADLLDGGPGRNKLVLEKPRAQDGNLGASWRVDNEAGTARTSGRTWYRWTRITWFDVSPLKAEKIAFTGSAADERIDLYRGARRVSVLGRGGDDTIKVDAQESGRVDGGQGTDLLAVAGSFPEGNGGLVVDLHQGTATAESADSVSALTLGSIEDASAYLFQTVRSHGSAAPNDIVTGRSCDVTVDGAGGDDTLTAASVCRAHGDAHPDPYGSVTMRGGGGDDLLTGNDVTDDFLDGGPGPDTADGRLGTDTCVAEIRVDCELG
jgi:hypothetical protein